MSFSDKKPLSWIITREKGEQTKTISTMDVKLSTGKEQLHMPKENMGDSKNHSLLSSSEEKDKKQKFGNFMGKLLLKSKSNLTSKTGPTIKEKNFKQTVLTNEPYAGLFRIRKNRSEHVKINMPMDTENKIKFSLKPKSNTSFMKPKDTTIYLNKKYRVINGRRTRWDIKDPFENKNINTLENQSNKKTPDLDENDDSMEINITDETNKNNENQVPTQNIEEGDDGSSVNSLQSDDDVLGPWIELGLIDVDVLSTQKDAETDYLDCQDCIKNSYNDTQDRGPFDTVQICIKCQYEWDPIIRDAFKKVVDNNSDVASKKVVDDSNVVSKKIMDDGQENEENFKSPKKLKLNHHPALKETNGDADNNQKKLTKKPSTQTVKIPLPKKTVVSVPPTRSRHNQKTNKKMMDKNPVNFTIVEISKPKNPINETKETKHVTTGAFMTRKTAQVLADPEYGFYPNPYGFVHRQHVEVLNLNGRWYRGTLEMMSKGKVKVRYDDWDDQEEWVIMGSRRLRSLSVEEEAIANQNMMNQSQLELVDVITIDENKSDSTNTTNGEVDLTSMILPPKTSTESSIKSNKIPDDYVSDTLDKDSTQIFNDNEVFVTRKMARELVDEHGFKPNSFGYRRNRAVTVTFYAKKKGERKVRSECVAFLREMRQDQIRVWYPNLHISEWFPVGSRRLKVLSQEEEDAILSKNNVDFNIQEIPNIPSSNIKESKPLEPTTRIVDNHTQKVDVPSHESQFTYKKGRGRPRKDIHKEPHTHQGPILNVMSSKAKKIVNKVTKTMTTVHLEPVINSPKPTITNEMPKEDSKTTFQTTGAFATRRAMRQLTDEYGFTPNPYGYTYNLAVEVLNIRSSKTKFWERGALVAMKPGQVKVHYDGWADIYDEWIKVGSRRIRVFTGEIDQNEEGSSIQPLELSDDHNISSHKGISNIVKNDLLMTESNPEISDEIKRNKKHAVVRPEDYQKLGLLENLEELAAKEAQKRERRQSKKKQQVIVKDKKKQSMLFETTGDDFDDNAYSMDEEQSGNEDYQPQQSHSRRLKKKSAQFSQPKRKIKQNILNSTSKKNHLHDQKCCHHHSSHQEQVSTSQNEKSVKVNQIVSLRLAQAEASKKDQFVANVYGYDYMQHVTVLHLDKKLYEGRLVGIYKNKVRVHYCGWIDTFDDYITLGSRRIQPIENDHEVVCIEPNYRERYEQLLQDDPSQDCSTCRIEQQQNKQTLVNRFSRKRLTLDDFYSDQEEENGDVEYHKENTEENQDLIETGSWKVYCNQCNVVIKQFRYYCTYCETPSQGIDYQSFELCLRCFDQNFPFWHEHPRSSFAIQSVIDTEIGPRPIKGELVTVWEEDILEDPANPEVAMIESSEPITSTNENELVPNNIESSVKEIVPLEASKIFPGTEALEINQGYKYLKKWKRRKVCAFCNDDDDTSEELGQFIGPFVIATFNKNGVEKKRSFWAHDSCARYSPEVFCTPEGKWYNVTLALRRGRGMRCHTCKEKGATIGCFESKCSKSFHLPCSQKPVSYFKNGVIFWCSGHEAYYNKIDTYVNVFNCDGCCKQLEDESWFTCVPCASSYFKSFDLCAECYEKFPADHPHNEDQFEETSFAIIKEMEAQKATEAAKEKEEQEAKKKKKPLFPRRRRKLPDGSLPVSCCYCGTYESDGWRKGYEGGVIMCNKCFELAILIDNDGQPYDPSVPLVIDNLDSNSQSHEQQYAAPIEDYSHKPYLTRDALSLTKFSESFTGSRLASYEPQPHQWFSLSFDSTYFDIPGRAPRWATHSGTDYHGTWLPQTVRRAILKHTSKEERVLSNFLGRGTDAIECFLLQRKCCGVDINPAAVTLSQRNCCFEIPPGLTSAEYRPIIAQSDSRNLSGALFTDESYHHILSHPPYKDCVAYSTHLDGDLSRFTNIEDFKIEYTKVVKESYRLLKMCRRLTLGIGDNREHCFYIPVGFHLMRLYVDQGFELEELVIKRQRYCSAFGLGTYLCVQFDFLVFTHEFIATFKKVPLENTDKMEIQKKDDTSDLFKCKRSVYGIPSSAILRKSVVMGTVWIFKPTDTYKFEQLCMSRMVERFGRDEGNWEHITLVLSQDEQSNNNQAESNNNEEANSLEDTVQSLSITEPSEDNSMTEYEKQRLKRIEENNKTLLKLGLKSELSEESEDIVHYDLMFNKETYPDGELVLMVTEHIPTLQPSEINSYRKTILQLAHEATTKLAPKGFLIIGTQDIRDSITGKLWPMTMLVLEDIEREVGREIIKLKEMVVTVPEGYSKDRKKLFKPNEFNEQVEEEEEIIDIETVENDHLPIVHAIYLIFQKF